MKSLNQSNAGEGEREYGYRTLCTADQVYQARQARAAYEQFTPEAARVRAEGVKVVKRIDVALSNEGENCGMCLTRVEPDPEELVYDDGFIKNLLKRHGVTIEEIYPRTCAETTEKRQNQLKLLKAVIRGNRRLPRWLLMQMRSTIEAGCKAFETARVEE